MPNPEYIKQTRLRARLTPTEAAELKGCTRVAWYRYEAGTRSMTAQEWAYWLHVAGIERIPFRLKK